MRSENFRLFVGCSRNELGHDPHPIRATNQVVGIIGYGWGSMIGQELAR